MKKKNIKEVWCQSCPRGELWRPKDIKEVADRARSAADRFCEMFKSDRKG